MTALVILLAIVAGLGIVAAWLGENPGSVTMIWFGYEIETSVAVLLLLAILASMALTFSYNLIKRMLLAPRSYSQRRSVKQYRIALNEVTYSVAALAASDITAASKHTKKAEKALGTTPLTLLLRAQISKSSGSDEESRKLLEQLLEHPETEYLAARSLADVAAKREMLPQALTLAQRAHHKNPKAKGGAWSVFDLHLSTGHFAEAEAQAKAARKSGAFSRADMDEALGRIALKQAETSLANGNKENALALAEKAVMHLPGNVKAAEVAAQLYADTDRSQKAIALIQKQWRVQPSELLASIFLSVIEAEKPAKREKLALKLAESNPSAPENATLRAD